MADTENIDESPAADEESGGGRSVLMTRIKIGVFVLLVIVVECSLASLYVPSAEDLKAIAEQEGVEGIPDPEENNEEEGKEDVKPTIEVDMKQYGVTAFQPTSNTTLRIDFHLFGIVYLEDQVEFDQLMLENEHRIREQILITVRSSEVTDLTDAGLGLIKRKILEKTNRSLGKPLVRKVIFSDFSFVEQ